MAERRHSISRNLALFCTGFFVVMGVVLGAIGFAAHRSAVFDQYDSYLHDVLMLVAEEVDADDLAQCIEQGVRTRSYNELQTFMDHVRATHSSLTYLYIVKPLNTNETNNVFQVVEGFTPEERRAGENTRLGDPSEDYYTAESARQFFSLMENPSQGVTYILDSTATVNCYTGAVALTNRAGEAVAVLGADVSLDSIDRSLYHYGINNVIAVLAVVVVFVLLMLWWMRKHIIRPLGAIERGVSSFVASSHGCTDPSALLLSMPSVRTNDEFQTLAESVTTMSQDMKDYVEHLLKARDEMADMRDQVEDLGEIAYVDALTGVKNKAAWMQAHARLQEKVEAGGAQFAILMADLNGLKAINDTYGHERGDVYLRNGCKLICDVFEHSPVFRVGGDEFLVLLEGRDYERRSELLNELLWAVEQAYDNENVQPWERVSFAVGMAKYEPQLDENADATLRRADLEMYLYKQDLKAAWGKDPHDRL